MSELQDIVDQHMVVYRVEQDWPTLKETTIEQVEAVPAEDVQKVVCAWLEALKAEEPTWGKGKAFLDVLTKRARGETLDTAAGDYHRWGGY